jgi:hypothetical protein
MLFNISTARADEADILIRQYEFPAMAGNPLPKIMFPHSGQATEKELEEEISWTAQSLQRDIESGTMEIRTVCLADGLPVGFAIWTLDQTPNKQELKDKADNNPERRNCECPSTLDVQSWIRVSRLLKAERTRVLQDLHDIWRG